jgi:uncharacterized protein (TIGR00290 family)
MNKGQLDCHPAKAFNVFRYFCRPDFNDGKPKMNKKPKAVFCWSGGKDSAYCLHKVLTENLFDISYLLTTVNDKFKRISMHGVREELLDSQTESIGIPLIKVRVTEGTNSEYERQMEAALSKAKSQGINNVIFGDIFLEDLRIYRENNLAKIEMTGVFPLWKMDTTMLINDFIRQKFKAVVCCTYDECLGEESLGCQIDNSFIEQLPAQVDPCGENGEYHTFCYDGPIFKKRIDFTVGEKVYKPLEIKTTTGSSATGAATKGFWFCDLLPNG